MVCERSDAFASACALARAFPLFTQRSGASRRPEKKTVTVEFFLVGQDNGPVEVSTLQVGVWKFRPGPRAALPTAPQLGQSSLSHSLGGRDRAAGIPEKAPGACPKPGSGLPLPRVVSFSGFGSIQPVLMKRLPRARRFHVLKLIILPVYVSRYPIWCAFTYVISFDPPSFDPFEARRGWKRFPT